MDFVKNSFVNANYFQVDSWLLDFTINYIFLVEEVSIYPQFYFFSNQSFQHVVICYYLP